MQYLSQAFRAQNLSHRHVHAFPESSPSSNTPAIAIHFGGTLRIPKI